MVDMVPDRQNIRHLFGNYWKKKLSNNVSGVILTIGMLADANDGDSGCT